jgi:hypothetical protein
MTVWRPPSGPRFCFPRLVGGPGADNLNPRAKQLVPMGGRGQNDWNPSAQRCIIGVQTTRSTDARWAHPCANSLSEAHSAPSNESSGLARAPGTRLCAWSVTLSVAVNHNCLKPSTLPASQPHAAVNGPSLRLGTCWPCVSLWVRWCNVWGPGSLGSTRWHSSCHDFPKRQ